MFTKAKLIAIVVLLTLAGVGVGVYVYRGKKVDKLETKVIEQKVQIDGLAKTVEEDKKSDAITEKTQERVVEKEKKIVDKDNKITQDLNKKEEAIRDEFKDASEPADLKKQADALSAARIDSLWRTWCEQTNQWSTAGCKLMHNPK